jgi:hypothetical protein
MRMSALVACRQFAMNTHLVVENLAARVEDLVLHRQKCAARVHEVNTRKMVLYGDLSSAVSTVADAQHGMYEYWAVALSPPLVVQRFLCTSRRLRAAVWWPTLPSLSTTGMRVRPLTNMGFPPHARGLTCCARSCFCKPIG